MPELRLVGLLCLTLANSWNCLEPAAYVEVELPIPLYSMEWAKRKDRADQDVSEIIRQAAVEHETNKLQWFRVAQERQQLPSYTGLKLVESSFNYLNIM